MVSSYRPQVWEGIILETPADATGIDRAAAVQQLLALAPSRVQALLRMRALTPADVRLTPELFALIAQHPDGRERQALLLMAPLLERTPDPADAVPAPSVPASTSARPAVRRGRRPR